MVSLKSFFEPEGAVRCCQSKLKRRSEVEIRLPPHQVRRQAVAFTCTPMPVETDGPIWCAEGPRVRPAGIATRQIDGNCNLVKGPVLQYQSNGSARGARTEAWCSAPRSGDHSFAMLSTGTVVRWDRYWRGRRRP
jgi:hypothetical protein